MLNSAWGVALQKSFLGREVLFYKLMNGKLLQCKLEF